MRTTVEVSDEHRAKLLELAAKRGEKGFSRLVQEAIDAYLAGLGRRDMARKSALAVLGTLDEEAAGHLERNARALRESWR